MEINLPFDAVFTRQSYSNIEYAAIYSCDILKRAKKNMFTCLSTAEFGRDKLGFVSAKKILDMLSVTFNSVANNTS